MTGTRRAQFQQRIPTAPDALAGAAPAAALARGGHHRQRSPPAARELVLRRPGLDQFWLDSDRLVVIRIIGSGRQGRTDTRLTNYVQTGGGWVATEIVQLVNEFAEPLTANQSPRISTGTALRSSN